jgi:hypothetical protein
LPCFEDARERAFAEIGLGAQGDVVQWTACAAHRSAIRRLPLPRM